MNLERFVSSRAAQWRELDALVRGARGGVSKLTPDRLLELGEHYRAAAADLALARRAFPYEPVTEELADLVGRARGVVYARAAHGETVGRFFSTTLWRELRAMSPLLWLSVAVIVGSVFLGVLWAVWDPQSASGLLPSGSHISVHSKGAFYGVSVASRGGLAAEIFVNNIIVACLVVVGGFTYGVITVCSLAYNGALLGVIGTLEWKGGGFSQFVRLVVPHGLLELSCFALAGAAGLCIARALIDPGRRSRAEALADSTPRIGAAIVGVMVFLVCAGTVEGFITPWDLSLPAALALGVALCTAFWSAVVLRGRRARREAREQPQTLASDFSRT
ncbi:MAG TPA: stage II sporulation protein M [Acidimicrobiales bacterium]|jgi:uncharacterized membrane protein SpoIIM required for sporulation|nr:stage II sporulation protein M [Acidimicrobiales bacterium]